MRRIVSVWLTDWPIAVWRRSAAAPPEGLPDPARPFALILRTQRGAVLHALNPAARAAGLRRGQTQADARAIRPDLECRPADPAADERALKALAGWAERWSPSVSVDPSPDGLEGLFLDVTGAARLFGGEAALLAQVRGRLAEAGVPARVACAPTPGAAWALARHGDPARADPAVADGELRAVLAPLPLEALRLDDRTVTQARRLGLKRIGDLYAMPRAGLARRFPGPQGLGLVTRLDQALGLAGEGLSPTRPPPRYRTWEAYAEPLGDVAGLEARLPELLTALAGALERDGQGARRVRVAAFRTDGAAPALEARTGRPGRDPKTWLRLLREKGLERIDLGFGADALMVSADEAEPMRPTQVDLETEARTTRAEGLAALIDRLSARLGEHRVLRGAAAGSWLPERAERLRPAMEGPGPAPADPGRRRPILLLEPPEPIEATAELPDGAPAQFTWRRVRRRVARADGPERLAPEWWRPRPDGRLVRTRDYYRVEDEDGGRYWLFREGLYGADYTGGADERAPSWWMHGVFP